MAIFEFVSHLLILLGAVYKVIDWTKRKNKQRETRNSVRQLFQEYRNRLQEIAVAQQTTDRHVTYKTKYGTRTGGSSHSDGNQRGGSVSLNRLQAVDKWLSALVMPPPGLAWAG